MYISDILPERNIAYSYDDVERGNRWLVSFYWKTYLIMFNKSFFIQISINCVRVP